MDATTPAWPSLSWAPASRRCAARGLRARARSHEDVHRRGPHTRPRELHELGRHEFRARAGDAGKVSRAQAGLRHRQSHLQRRSAAFRAVELGEVQPRKGAKNTKEPSRASRDWDGFYPTGSPARNLALRSLCPFAVIPFRSSLSGPGRRVCTQRGSKRAGSQAGQAEDGSYSFGFRPTPQMSQTASATRRMSHQK